MAYDIQTLLNKAIAQPDMFYQNFIANEAVTDYQVVSIDEMPFSSVYSFVFLNSEKGKEFSDIFLRNYSEEIISERNKINGDVSPQELARLTTLCPILNSLLFKDEWNAILNCNSIEDFKQYLSDNFGCCEEFDLYAKYQISQKENSFFEDFNTVLTKYYNSVLFDIKELKRKCDVINGIHVMWNDNISGNQKDAITSILEEFVKKGSDFILNKPITKKQFYVITNNFKLDTLNRICDDLEKPAIVSYYDAERFIESLQRLASIKSFLLSPSMIKSSLPVMSKCKTEFVDLLEWCKSEGGVEYAFAISLDVSRVNKHAEVKISKKAFATFRITI